jgi:hypothetical protein
MYKKEKAFTRHACICHCQRTESQKSGNMRTQRVSLVQRRDAPSPLDTVTLSQIRFDRSNRSRECERVAAISIFIRQIIAKSITPAARKRTAPSCSHSNLQTCGQPPPVSTRSKSQAPSPPRCSHLRLCASRYFLKHPPPCSSSSRSRSSRSSSSKQHAAARTHSLAQRVMYSKLQLCRLRPLRPPAQRRRPRITLHKCHVTRASAARSKQQPGQAAQRQSEQAPTPSSAAPSRRKLPLHNAPACSCGRRVTIITAADAQPMMFTVASRAG